MVEVVCGNIGREGGVAINPEALCDRLLAEFDIVGGGD